MGGASGGPWLTLHEKDVPLPPDSYVAAEFSKAIRVFLLFMLLWGVPSGLGWHYHAAPAGQPSLVAFLSN